MVSLKTNPASPYKIGDILTTTRTDLGDDWLLCDGSTYDKTLYPELYNVYGWLYNKMISNTITDIIVHNIVYNNGYYIACGDKCIKYSTQISDLHAKDFVDSKTIFNNISSGILTDNGAVYDIIYANNIYIAVGYKRYNYDSHYNGCNISIVAYSNNITGPWNSIELWRGENSNESYDSSGVESIIYTNGMYIAYGYQSFVGRRQFSRKFKAQIAINNTPNLTSGWQTITLNEVDSSDDIYNPHSPKLKILNNNYITATMFYYNIINSKPSCTNGGIFYWNRDTIATDINTPNYLSVSSFGLCYCIGFTYENGYYIAYGNIGDSGAEITDHKAAISYSTNITGPYTVLPIGQNINEPVLSPDEKIYDNFNQVIDIKWTGKYYIIMCVRKTRQYHITTNVTSGTERVLLYVSDIEDSQYITINKSVSTITYNPTDVASDYIVYINDNTITYNRTIIDHIPNTVLTVPQLPSPTYIKAK